MKVPDDFVVVVPARAGSKGYPNKNLATFDGEPLALRALHQGLRVSDSVIMTTDIQEFHALSVPENCLLVRRPDHLAGDTVSMEEVLIDLCCSCGLVSRTIILLQPTSPMRSDTDILQAVEVYLTGRFSLVASVSRANSEVLKMGMVSDGQYTPMKNASYCFSNRQNLPPVYRLNGAIYIFSTDELLKKNSFPTDAIGVYEMPADRSIDIDTEDDLTNAQLVHAAQLR